MTASEIAAYLLQTCATLSEFDGYMFGSTLYGVGADIDILIIGPPGDGLSRLKRELRIASERLPLHVLYLQPSEAKRTDFVARENCVPLASLGRIDLAGSDESGPPTASL
jgi:hypothetical protein